MEITTVDDFTAGKATIIIIKEINEYLSKHWTRHNIKSVGAVQKAIEITAKKAYIKGFIEGVESEKGLQSFRKEIKNNKFALGRK